MKCNHISFSFKFFVVFLILFGNNASQVSAQLTKETAVQKNQRLQWWSDARFGMFIHWGLYSLPARHEWVRNFERIPNEEYQKYFDIFNPDLYNPREWAKMCKQAGMKYAVITTKHHEGFCLLTQNIPITNLQKRLMGKI